MQTDREWDVRTKARDRQELLQQKNKLVQYEKMQEAKEKRRMLAQQAKEKQQQEKEKRSKEKRQKEMSSFN
ncbi:MULTISPECIES: hypothetical protein [unclassified Spiroplasma]|uniref:hypothetical protein n=1 Tax=unclassified Spiroplasma TaxID=2637901 RepID=UPI00313AB49A